MTNSTFSRPEASTESIDYLLKLVQNGKIIIPIFQRNFVWEKKDIKDLFDSIYRGYPIGNLLLWKKRLELPDNKIKIGPLEFNLSESNDLLAVIDGQQRLTSLASVLLLNSAMVSEEEKSKWELYFNLEKKEFVFPIKNHKSYYYWLPMKVVADTSQYLKWLRGLDENDKYIEIADNLVTAIREYKIPVYRVESDEDEVREIFQRLNDMGKSLEESDIFNAIVSGRENNNSDRIQDIQDILEEKGCGIPKDNTLLKSIYAISDIPLGKTSIKKVKDPDTKNQIAELSKEIPYIYDKVMTFLQKFADIDHLFLLPYYNVTLIPLMKIFYHFPEPSDSLQEHISSWIWRASLSEAHKNPKDQGMNQILKKIYENKNNEEKLINGFLNEEFGALNIDNFEVKKFHFRAAKVKILSCSLLNESPKNLQTEDTFDFRKIFLQHNTGSFKYIFTSNKKVSKEHFSMLGNRILNHDFSHKSYPELLETAFNNVSEETLLRHFIDNYAIELFQEEMFQEFIEHRTSLMNEKAREFLKEKCC
jgi:uncharacterized protein with ParB-like and HNH nuclease domain